MKIKTSELTGPALDWAVAKCLGWVTYPTDSIEHGDWYHTNAAVAPHGYEHNRVHRENFKPSTDWSQGGPILSRERINRTIDHSGLWVAYWTDGYGEEDYCKKWMQCDRSELVAGLRCYVASKLGDEVDVPDELINN